jgi:hypothetical protein
VARTGSAGEESAGSTASAAGDTDDGAEAMGDAGMEFSAGWPITGGEPTPRIVAERMNRAAIRNVVGMLVERLGASHCAMLVWLLTEGRGYGAM